MTFQPVRGRVETASALADWSELRIAAVLRAARRGVAVDAVQLICAFARTN